MHSCNEKSKDSIPGTRYDLILGHSFDACDHFKITIQFPLDQQYKAKLSIVSTDPHEMKLLKEKLQIQNEKGEYSLLVFNEHNEAEVDVDSLLFCGDFFIAPITQNQLSTYKHKALPEFRLLSAYNAERTMSDPTQSYFYAALSSTIDAVPSAHKRIDGHTHMIGTYPMKNALERAMKLNSQPQGSLYIPSLVVIHILKAKDIINKNNEHEWLEFFSTHKSLHDPKTFGKQKNSSKDLINEEFNRDITMYLNDAETEVCFSNQEAYYLDLKTLKEKLGDPQWGNFCNGFDLDATHACDFTEHMEMAYTLRNWFGKDRNFLQAQLESIYDLYEKQGVHYAELPASFFKQTDDLKIFCDLTQQIERQREQDSKPLVTLRASLSIARGISPALFRKTLFQYIPLIIQNSDLASITVLAHEVNPTTAHIQAIKDFIEVIDKVRPGFTVEIHAGETEFYGEVNLNEARSIARGAPATIIRAGHASYGNHNEYSLANYIEEKCPLSNATLIDQKPETLINVALGIAEGKTNIFWGSDGCIYDPQCGPKNQETFFKSIIAHPICVHELKRRFEAKPPEVDAFGQDNFADYLSAFAKNFNQQIARNREHENDYIDFKKNEKMLHTLRLLVNYIDAGNQISLPSLYKKANEFVNEAERFVGFGYKEFAFWLRESEHQLNEIYNHFRSATLITKLDFSKLTPDEIPLDAKKIILDRIKTLFSHFSDDENLTRVQATALNGLRKFIVVTNKQEDLHTWLEKSENTAELFEHYKCLQLLFNNKNKMLISSNVDILTQINPDSLPIEVKKVASSRLLADKMNPSLQERTALELFSDLYKLTQFYIENETIEPPNWYQNIRNVLFQVKDHKESIIHFVHSLPEELKNNVSNEMVHQKITSKPLSDQYAYKGHPASEKLLDPNWEYLKHNAEVRHTNQLRLKAHSQNKQEVIDNIRLKTTVQPLVLFGEPERCNDNKQQKEYLSKLYNTVYQLIKERTKAHGMILLLGGIEDGINPLVHKIVNEHPELKETKIRHLLTGDESISKAEKEYYPELFSDNSEYIAYLIIPGRREEAHIAYSDFMEQNNINHIIMFGGDHIWSDTKTVLDQRRDQNDAPLKDQIKYYEDGFNETRTSYAYAKGLISSSKENQVLRPVDGPVPTSIDELTQSELYCAKLFKTMPLYHDLNHTWVALQELTDIETQITQQHFYNLFFSEERKQTQGNQNRFFPPEKQLIARSFVTFFTHFINTAGFNDLENLKKTFTRYGTIARIQNVLLDVANFNLQNTINEREQLLTQKPT